RFRVHVHIGGTSEASHVVTSGTLAAMPNLKQEFSTRRKLEDLILGPALAIFRSDPNIVSEINENSVLMAWPGPLVAGAGTTPAWNHATGLVKFNHGWEHAVDLRCKQRTMQNPDVVVRVDSKARDHAELEPRRRPSRVNREMSKGPFARSDAVGLHGRCS